eukprot:93129_1
MLNLLLVAICIVLSAVSQKIPEWTAPQPDNTKPLGGYKRISNATNIEIFHGTNPNDTAFIQGAYNHASMIGYHNGVITVLWKNCQKDEDCNGQRILYSQSNDGRNFTFPRVAFTNLTVPDQPTGMFVGPPIIINNRQYIGASPGPYNESHDQTAQGSQFCLWPEPIDPRNCGPPGAKGIYGQANHTLLMRQILPGLGKLGAVFWASNIAPTEYDRATQTFDILTLSDMDSQTQNDIMSLYDKKMNGYCNNSNTGTLKCEVCNNGCQNYQSIDTELKIGNERSHYILPSKDMDVILYRCESHVFYVSMRNISLSNNTFGKWSTPIITNIPNDNSNLNLGILPDKRIYLVNNPVTPAPAPGISARDPITLTTSKDGYIFDNVGVVMTCTNLSVTSTCYPRYEGHSKNRGPSYPQLLTVVDPAPKSIQGIYVTGTNNKEDVW